MDIHGANIHAREIAGTFRLTLEFSEEYPNKAPVVKFKSQMFHPNSECFVWGFYFYTTF